MTKTRALEQAAAHHAAVRFQQRHRFPIALLQVVDIDGRDLLNERGGQIALDLNQGVRALALPHFHRQTMVGITATGQLKVDTRFLS